MLCHALCFRWLQHTLCFCCRIMSRNFLSKNDELRKGDYLVSNNGEWKAVFQVSNFCGIHQETWWMCSGLCKSKTAKCLFFRTMVTLSSMAGSLCGLQTLLDQMFSVCACRKIVTWLCTTRMVNPNGTQTLPNPNATCVVFAWPMRANFWWTGKLKPFGTLRAPQARSDVFKNVCYSHLWMSLEFPVSLPALKTGIK